MRVDGYDVYGEIRYRATAVLHAAAAADVELRAGSRTCAEGVVKGISLGQHVVW